MKDWAAFPLLFMNLHEPWDQKSWTEAVNGAEDLGRRFLFNSGNDADAILRVARTPMILFTLALGWLMFWWVRKQFGGAVALLALFLYALSPTFLAHGRFVTTDVGAAAGFFIGTIAFLPFLKNPTRRNGALAGIAMGFALLTKFTTVALVPITGILAVAWALVHEEPGNRASWTNRSGKLLPRAHAVNVDCSSGDKVILLALFMNPSLTLWDSNVNLFVGHYTRCCGVVSQEDTHLAALTVYAVFADHRGILTHGV
jgi:hypothetical protein